MKFIMMKKQLILFINTYEILTYPNLTVTLEDGTLKKVKDYYPEIKNYYYKFDTKPII